MTKNPAKQLTVTELETVINEAGQYLSPERFERFLTIALEEEIYG